MSTATNTTTADTTDTAITTVIDIAGLTKSFGPTQALAGLDLTVTGGEVHGFLGPNGAGKSTTIRTLLGLLRADAGRVRLFGRDPWREAPELHRRLAYVPGDVTLWPGLTGGEAIDLLGRLHGRRSDQRTRVDELLQRFDLDPTKKAKTYSKGNRQKVALVAAFAADAELLVLDEPTSGLDPLMEQVFRDCVVEEKRRGRTVLLSSHLLSEVEALCDRVSIVRDGRTVESGTLDELRHLSRTTIDAEFGADADGDAVAGWPGVRGMQATGRRLRFDVDPESLTEVLRRLADSGLVGLTAHPPTLEDLFLRQYRRDGSDLGTDTSGDAPLVGAAASGGRR